MTTNQVASLRKQISSESLDQLFREARTHRAWLPGDVPVSLLREVYELARRGSDECKFVAGAVCVSNYRRS